MGFSLGNLFLDSGHQRTPQEALATLDPSTNRIINGKLYTWRPSNVDSWGNPIPATDENGNPVPVDPSAPVESPTNGGQWIEADTHTDPSLAKSLLKMIGVTSAIVAGAGLASGAAGATAPASSAADITAEMGAEPLAAGATAASAGVAAPVAGSVAAGTGAGAASTLGGFAPAAAHVAAPAAAAASGISPWTVAAPYVGAGISTGAQLWQSHQQANQANQQRQQQATAATLALAEAKRVYDQAVAQYAPLVKLGQQGIDLASSLTDPNHPRTPPTNAPDPFAYEADSMLTPWGGQFKPPGAGGTAANGYGSTDWLPKYVASRGAGSAPGALANTPPPTAAPAGPMVLMQAPNGTQQQVPTYEQAYWEGKGAKVVGGTT